MENLSVQNVLSRRDSYNLAIPFMETQQVNPFYKMSVSLLYADTNEQASQIFKVGSRPAGNKWENLYSLAKPFLQRLATEAGIQFGPGSGDVVKMDENTWKAGAFGAIRLPDGSVRTSSNFKVIDLVTEEKKYRSAYGEKAEKGIEEYKAAKAAAEKYAGEWADTGRKNDQGYPVKIYVIAGQDRRKYIENSLLDAMTQLRANAPQKAATGAILRVIRDLLGIKGTYTIDELKKPFAVARMSFSPDYNDPVIKQMLLQQAMHSIGNLFGSVQPVVQTLSIPKQDSADEPDMPADADEFKTAAGNGHIPAADGPAYQAEPEAEEEDRSMDFRCDKCNEVIPKNVWDYSREHFDDRPLCRRCQNIIRMEQRGGRRQCR